MSASYSVRESARQNTVGHDGAPKTRHLSGTDITVAEDGSACLVVASFDNGEQSRTLLSFATLSRYLHKLHAAAAKMVNRQRLYDVNHGVAALRALAASPLQAAAVAVAVDKTTYEITLTFQFHDMAPVAIALSPGLVKDMKAELLLSILGGMN